MTCATRAARAARAQAGAEHKPAVVGSCYHKAADLRVCQAAHSLSCVRSCSALLLPVRPIRAFEILNQRLTVPLRVWSLTKCYAATCI